MGLTNLGRLPVGSSLNMQAGGGCFGQHPSQMCSFRRAVSHPFPRLHPLLSRFDRCVLPPRNLRSENSFQQMQSPQEIHRQYGFDHRVRRWSHDRCQKDSSFPCPSFPPPIHPAHCSILVAVHVFHLWSGVHCSVNIPDAMDGHLSRIAVDFDPELHLAGDRVHVGEPDCSATE